MLVCYLYLFFGEVSSQVFGEFFIRLFLCTLSFDKSLYILDIGPVSLILSPNLKLVFSFS